MNQPIHSVRIVSDGILVEFADGTCGYYPETFLRDKLTDGPNYVFLNYDPSPTEEQIHSMPIADSSAASEARQATAH